MKGNKSIVIVAKFKQLGTISTNRKCIHKELGADKIRRGLTITQSRICCFPCHLSKNLEIKRYKTVIARVHFCKS